MSTVLKPFQETAILNAFGVLSECLDDIKRLRGQDNFLIQRNIVVSYKGNLLFEAPTGTGKTLMAGSTVEKLSLKHNIIWLWFAPYSGLIDQSIRTIRSEFPNLRVRDLSKDRSVQDLRSGDVFVTTWAGVAVSNTASRKTRQDTEMLPAVDTLIQFAKAIGVNVGAVIDEAHHSFLSESQAFNFYREILAPDITIMATATPKDADVELFKQRSEVKHLYRISVSRQQGVDAGLLKEGVKVAVFKTKNEVSELIDFQKTALFSGVQTHWEIKRHLQKMGATITPLLLVQADSKDNSIPNMIAWLKEWGFRDEQIRSHTSVEPDPYLLAIAHDETVEVLIFKMAVATGFDVPRAFTLVSMRTARDVEFGIQIVGRIMRVDRRLQGNTNFPAPLRYGYVFLADKEGQTGLISAAQRINTIKDELSPVAPVINVVAVESGPSGGSEVLFVHNNQFELNLPNTSDKTNPADEHQNPKSNVGDFAVSNSTDNPLPQYGAGFEALLGELGLKGPVATGSVGGLSNTGIGNQGGSHQYYRYPLRTDIDFPKQFKTAVVSLNRGNIVSDVVALFRFDERTLMVAQQSATNILMEETEIFRLRKDSPKVISALLAQKEIDRLAQKSLFEGDRDGMVDVRDLFEELEGQLTKEFIRAGLPHLATPSNVRDSLNKILALRKDILKQAIQDALAKNVEVVDADSIPEQIVTTTELDPSRLNVYAVYPDDLNTWERPFAEELDSDVTGTVKWWHRNPVKKPWSVRIPLPGQPNFYPDFIVGVHNRNKGEGILLLETKREINDGRNNAQTKAQAEHPTYKRIMMVYWQKEKTWHVVEFDPVTDKNFLSREFRFELLTAY